MNLFSKMLLLALLASNANAEPASPPPSQEVAAKQTELNASLMQAARQGNANTISALLAAGADPNAKGKVADIHSKGSNEA